MVSGKFTYEVALGLKNEIKAQGGNITRQELARLLMQRTGTMMPWFIKSYMQNMVAAGFLKTNEDGFEVI